MLWEARKDYIVEELLYDVSTVQRHLFNSLDEDAKKKLRDLGTDMFVGVLAGQGYEFCGAGLGYILAIYWLGAAIVPLCWFALLLFELKILIVYSNRYSSRRS